MDDASTDTSVGRRAARAVLWPARRFFDPRFHALNIAVETTGAKVDDAAAGYGEVLSFMRRELERLVDQTAEVSGRLDQVTDLLAPVADSRGAAAAMREGVASLNDDLAQFLNHAESHVGFLAERNLWFNSPLSFRYEDGDVVLGHVNERIVEVPFAYRALGDVAIGSTVLDVGACESTVAFGLATLGYRVTALDLRPYPLSHPNLRSVAEPLETAALDERSFDAVLCISSIEHFGLDGYGPAGSSTPEGDVAALTRVRSLLKPAGVLVLTVPYGFASEDGFQRVYDTPRLDRLLDGWRLTSRMVLEQRGPTEWAPVDEGTLVPEPGRRYVAMVTGTAEG